MSADTLPRCSSGLKRLDRGSGRRPSGHRDHPARTDEEEVRGEADDDRPDDAEGGSEEQEGRASTEARPGAVAPDADHGAQHQEDQLRGSGDVAEHLIMPGGEFGDAQREAVCERHHHRDGCTEVRQHQPEDVAAADLGGRLGGDRSPLQRRAVRRVPTYRLGCGDRVDRVAAVEFTLGHLDSFIVQ